MRVNVAIPEAHVDAPVLDAALESVTRLNESMLAEGLPTFDRALHRGIKWKPEPPGAEHFDHAAMVLKRGWGDCDDLAPYHAATLRHTGEDPGATAIVKRSGPKSWHAIVRRSDGTIDDPSARAGMGPNIPHGVRGATLPLMYPLPKPGVDGAYIIRPQIALRPFRGQAQARIDIPWQWREHLNDKPTPGDYAMTALHMAPTANTALTGGIDEAVHFARIVGFADDEHLLALEGLADLVGGMHPDEVSEIYGEEIAQRASQVVGSFFSHFNPMHTLKSFGGAMLHNPLTSMAANFVPGGRAALDMANLIPGFHGGGGGGGAMPTPAFPGMPGGHRATVLFD